jgi:putative SOS response-associated peptidase YedK
MCGRFTVKATWAELVALYRLTMDAPPHNLRPRYNVCPTDPVDVVTAERQLVTMRWGLVALVVEQAAQRTPDGDFQRQS